MPLLEDTFYLQTEGDVVRASFLYLLHPVHIVISQLLRIGTLHCRIEATAGEGSRTDVRWTYRNGDLITNIAVLEFKNTRVIHFADMEAAMAINATEEKAKRNEAVSKDKGTLFERSAYWISKQAKKYSRDVGIPDVAIFDWGALFVFDFSNVDEDAEDPILARGIYFQERSDWARRGATFRSLLLGFLARALERQNIIT